MIYKSGTGPTKTFTIPYQSKPTAIQWINVGTIQEGHTWYDGDFGEIPSNTQIRIRTHSSSQDNDWCLFSWGY